MQTGKINVNIVEGEYMDKNWYNQVKKDYLKCEETVLEIRRKYDIGTMQWAGIRGRIIEEEGKVRFYDKHLRKNVLIKVDKHYSHHNARKKKWERTNKHGERPKNYAMVRTSKGILYKVNKMIDGETFFFGLYDSEEMAQEVVAKLRELNWNEDEWEKVKAEVIA